MSRRLLTNLVLTSALVASIPAFADVLSTTGSVNISNSAVHFYPLGGSSGTFNVGAPDTGTFSGLVGTTGAIKDLTTLPINTTINIPDFMTFANAANLSITLTEINGGTLPACSQAMAAAGQSCSPTGTPYNLSNQTATSSVGSASVEGYLVDSNKPGVLTPLTGLFSTQFVNMSYQQLISTVDGGGSVDATYSAQFITSPTPEPGTVGLLFSGVLMLGFAKFGARFRRTSRVRG